MSTTTTHDATHYADRVTDTTNTTAPASAGRPALTVEDYPSHVQAVLSAIKTAHDDVTAADKVYRDALAKRRAAVRDSYLMLADNGLGPADIERATGIGRSNVRILAG